MYDDESEQSSIEYPSHIMIRHGRDDSVVCRGNANQPSKLSSLELCELGVPNFKKREKKLTNKSPFSSCI